MTLGSLFDGIGGFPLAGSMYGITPVWAAEIEPFPIRVTQARFPDMVHLGSVTEINGGEIPPVDVISFGSPCQDLSTAGHQKGIHEGTRSSLFFEAIRIIREMREHDRAAGRSDVDLRPRFAVWENVPGAFSSNGGDDFRAVLQAFCSIKGGRDHIVPRPPKGKWGNAGCVVGEGYSIAWRIYDAQYWPGTPQRRKRIYLVADFATERAGEILFESEGMCGDSAQGGETREGASGDAQGGAGGSRAAGFKANQGSRAGGIGWQDGLSCTLNADCPGLEPTVCYDTTQITSPLNYSCPLPGDPCPPLAAQQHPPLAVCLKGNAIDRETRQNGRPWSEHVAYTLDATDRHGVVARTLTAEHDGSPCLDRGPNVIIEAAGFSDALGEKAQGGMEYMMDASPTLRAGDVRSVVYDARGEGGGQIVPTLTGDHENRVTDYTGVAVYPETTGAFCANSHPGSYTGQDAMNDMLPVVRGNPPRKYIVRRLTPLECLRLQGYPDWWFDGVEGSDSAKYKACGNSLAIPCAADVMRRIAKEVSR